MKAEFAMMAIELNIECPNKECDEYFDLFDNQYFTEEGFLYELLMPKDAPWGNKNFQKEIDDADMEIRCPKCNTLIEVESVEW